MKKFFDTTTRTFIWLAVVLCIPVYSADKYPGEVNIRTGDTPTMIETGEQIDFMRGYLSFETIDFIVPGSNGLDVVISRSYNNGIEKFDNRNTSFIYGRLNDWEVELPRIVITTNPWGFTRGNQPEGFDNFFETTETTRTGVCNDPYPGRGRAFDYDNFEQAEYYWSGINLKIPGQSWRKLVKHTDTDNRYPSDTKWVSVDDWVATCTVDGNGFIVKSPAGITYTMDVIEANYSHNGFSDGWSPGHNKAYASNVSDRFGNKIVYNFSGTQGRMVDRVTHLGRTYTVPQSFRTIQTITLKDRTGDKVVSFHHDDSESGFDRITYNGRAWEYKYEPSRVGTPLKSLTKVIRPDLSEWNYKYEGVGLHRFEMPGLPKEYHGPNRLTNISLPTGGSVEYNYKVFSKLTNDPYSENIKLWTKTISDGEATFDSWTFNYQNHTDSTIKVTIDKTLEKEELVFKNDKSFKHGKLVSRKQYTLNSVGTTLDTRLTEFAYQEIAEIGEFTFHDYPKNVPDSLITKSKLIEKKVTEDDNVYLTEYLDHDVYGKPTKIKETFAGKSKYTQLGYQYKKQDRWLLWLPTTVSVSSSDSNYTTVSEIVYHNSSTTNGAYSDLALPYEERSFGRWTKRYTAYSTQGNIEKIEFNDPLLVGTGNRYVEYDDYKLGIPQEITTPSTESDQSVTQNQVVDDNGWVTSKTDRNQVTTGYSYDDMGRLNIVNLENDSRYDHDWYDTVISWNYDADGYLIKTTSTCILNDQEDDCEGAALTTLAESFDGLMRKTLQTRQNGTHPTEYKNFTYNKFNQITFESHWSSTSTETKGITTNYDSFQRVKSISNSGLGTTSYDYLAGNQVSVTDSKDYTTTTTFRAYGQPEYTQATLIESPEDVTTEIEIDVFGLVKTVTQSGYEKDGSTPVSSSEIRKYDQYKQLCLISRPDVGNNLYNHNALGEMNWIAEGVANTECTAVKPASYAVSYTRDNVGNTKNINYPDSFSRDITYTRDDNGNVLTVELSGDIVQTYNYNNRNLLEDENVLIGTEKSLSLGYGYNAFGLRDFISYPDGTKVGFNVNGLGRPTEIGIYEDDIQQQPIIRDINFYPTNQLHQFTFANGTTHTTTLHNDSKLPRRLSDENNGSPITDLEYEYDSNGNIKSIQNYYQAGYSLNSLTYDGLDRLRAINGDYAIGNTTVQYDSLNNITSLISKNSSLSYDYDYSNNRLSSVTGTGSESKSYSNFGYDSRGNITNNSHRSFTYNKAGQMYSSGSNSYIYDAFNRRIKQTDANGVNYSLYSKDGVLLYRETDVENGSGIGTNYVYLGSKLVAKITDSTAPINTRTHYNAFGSTVTGSSDDIGYTGHKFDTDLSLSYMQARYYDPVIGRFYSNDPVGFKNVHNFNRYAYANNNPYKYVDPDGRDTRFIGGAGVDGGYIPDMKRALGAAGISNVSTATNADSSTFNMITDAASVIMTNQVMDGGNFTIPTNLADGEQLNLIGYSWGGVVAAQRANVAAGNGQTIDNLVLIGAPINGDLLKAVQSNPNIKNVHVMDLTSQGDPIYAGMSDAAIVGSVPALIKQMSQSSGHFFYAPNTAEGAARRTELGKEIAAKGLQ